MRLIRLQSINIYNLLYLTLWFYLRYVLLKEKNMLLTIAQEAKRQAVQMPSPERLRKVCAVLNLKSIEAHRNKKVWLEEVVNVSKCLHFPCTQVERSMIRLETVVNERETALRLLQTGQEKGRPGAWRKNLFGYVYWWVQSVQILTMNCFHARKLHLIISVRCSYTLGLSLVCNSDTILLLLFK